MPVQLNTRELFPNFRETYAQFWRNFPTYVRCRFLPAGEAHFEGKIPTEGLTSAYASAKVAEVPNVIDVAVPSVGQALATESLLGREPILN